MIDIHSSFPFRFTFTRYASYHIAGASVERRVATHVTTRTNELVSVLLSCLVAFHSASIFRLDAFCAMGHGTCVMMPVAFCLCMVRVHMQDAGCILHGAWHMVQDVLRLFFSDALS